MSDYGRVMHRDLGLDAMVFECDVCGAILFNRGKHTAWHNRMQERKDDSDEIIALERILGLNPHRFPRDDDIMQEYASVAERLNSIQSALKVLVTSHNHTHSDCYRHIDF